MSYILVRGGKLNRCRMAWGLVDPTSDFVSGTGVGVRVPEVIERLGYELGVSKSTLGSRWLGCFFGKELLFDFLNSAVLPKARRINHLVDSFSYDLMAINCWCRAPSLLPSSIKRTNSFIFCFRKSCKSQVVTFLSLSFKSLLCSTAL